MDTIGMEDFSLLMDDWVQNQYDFDHYDDLNLIGPGNAPYVSVKAEPQAFENPIDVLEVIEDSIPDNLRDPFGAEWMENGDLLQLLDIHLADSPDIPEAHPNFLADDSLSTKGSDAAEKVAPNVQKCYEFLQDLLKQNNETSIVVPSHQEVSVELPIVKPSHADIKLLVGEEVIVDFESPFSVDDVESLLSSAVPSPSSTIDSSSLSDSNSIVCKSELYQLVSNVTEGQKSRGSPYSRSQSGSRSPKSKGRKQTASISPSPSDHELEFMSKKDRKKLQNKNAAIRYRMKKKEEADSVKDEESQLEEINQNLTEKVEQLTREIKYMQDLIIEVRKARGL